MPTRKKKPKPEWEGRRLFVAFPCYKTTNPATAWVLVATAMDYGKEKIRMDMELGDAMIYHARNKLTTRFLETECEWMLFLDDDIIPPIGRPEWFKYIGHLPDGYPDDIAGQNYIDRLLSHGKTIVGATYFGRQASGRPMFHAGITNYDHCMSAREMRGDLIETEWAATGCLLIHRSVFEDIKKKMPDLAPTELRDDWDFFRPTANGGEDVAFCHRAREAGHAIFVDTGVQCLHVGYQCYGAHNTKSKLEEGF